MTTPTPPDKNPPLPRHWETPIPAQYPSPRPRRAARDTFFSTLLSCIQHGLRSVVIEVEVEVQERPHTQSAQAGRRGNLLSQLAVRGETQSPTPTPTARSPGTPTVTSNSNEGIRAAYGIPTTMSTGRRTVPEENITIVVTIEVPQQQAANMHPQRRQSDAQESRDGQQYLQRTSRGYVSEPEPSTATKGWQAPLPFRIPKKPRMRKGRQLQGLGPENRVRGQSASDNRPIVSRTNRDTGLEPSVSPSRRCERSTLKQSAAKRKRHDLESEDIEHVYEADDEEHKKHEPRGSDRPQ